MVYSSSSWALGLGDEGFLNWYPRSALTTEELEALPAFCHGAYRVPDIQSFDNERIEAEANNTEMDANNNAIFSGEVVIQQFDRVIKGDRARWNTVTGQGELEGQVTLTSPDVVLYGDSAKVDDAQGKAEFFNAEYAFPAKHFRGSASYINASNNGLIDLERATLTFCEPGHNDWRLATSKLHLDQNTQMGSAWHTRMEVWGLPVFYFPYYYFPIGDQRLTGFLNPSLSFTSKLQAKDIQLPFYLNIAPNLDATITPHYIQEHGVVLENQLRHKTRWFGDGELNYNFISHDEETEDKRFLLNYKQQGSLGHGWQHRWLYNQVSDVDFINDLKPLQSTDRTTHLPRRGEILWNQDNWHFDITAEEFQTIDPTIALKSYPFGRMPQLNLTYKEKGFNQLIIEQTLQATRFKRRDELWLNNQLVELKNFDALMADRLLSNTSVAYPMEWPFGFLRPKVEYRYRSYSFTNADDSIINRAEPQYQDSVSIQSPRYSLDAGLYFDREFKLLGSEYTQTFEPRAYWVKSPLVEDQEYIPNFDSAELTVTFNSLFYGDRFSGGDRLADLDQFTAGATTRFIREDGLEQLRFSAGQIFYNKPRQVILEGKTAAPEDDYYRSGLMAELEINPIQELSLMSSIEWDPYQHFARQTRYSLRYASHNNHFLNIARNSTKIYNRAKDEILDDTDQLDTGIFWSLSDRWAVFARALKDLKEYEVNEPKPYHPVLESLAGIEYQTCCWRFQVSYRETSSQARIADYTTKKDYGIMFTLQLKGLSGVGKGIDAVMNEEIPGYSRRIYHDF